MKNIIRNNNRDTIRRAAAALLAAALACTSLAACANNNAPLSRDGKVKQLAVCPAKEYKNEDEKWEAELQERHDIDADLCEKLAYFAYDTASPLLREEVGNTVYSPLSLYYALSLAAAGAEGETQAQILSLLRMNDAGELSDRAGKQFKVFYRDEDSYKFQMANSVWFDSRLRTRTCGPPPMIFTRISSAER